MKAEAKAGLQGYGQEGTPSALQRPTPQESLAPVVDESVPLYIEPAQATVTFSERVSAIAITLWQMTGPMAAPPTQDTTSRSSMRQYKVGFEGRNLVATVLSRESDRITFRIADNEYDVYIAPMFSELRDRGSASGARSADELRAPISGIISKLLCKKGQAVKSGEPLVVLEAMKMENNLCALDDGTIVDVLHTEGAEVGEGELLVKLAVRTSEL